MLLQCLEIGRSLKKDKGTLSSSKAGSKDTIFLLTPFQRGKVTVFLVILFNFANYEL